MRHLLLVIALLLACAAPAAARPADAGRDLVPAEAHPVKGAVGYGESGARYGTSRGSRMHEGQDVFAPAGTPLRAIRDAVVIETGDGGGRGHYIALYSREHDETYVYLHMQRPSPRRAGERVEAGERIGAVGCTGSCWGDHLHFEIRRGRGLDGRTRDPLPLLRELG